MKAGSKRKQLIKVLASSTDAEKTSAVDAHAACNSPVEIDQAKEVEEKVEVLTEKVQIENEKVEVEAETQ